MLPDGRTSTDQSDRKGLDGELKKGLRRIEDRKKAEYTNRSGVSRNKIESK